MLFVIKPVIRANVVDHLSAPKLNRLYYHFVGLILLRRSPDHFYVEHGVFGCSRSGFQVGLSYNWFYVKYHPAAFGGLLAASLFFCNYLIFNKLFFLFWPPANLWFTVPVK